MRKRPIRPVNLIFSQSDNHARQVPGCHGYAIASGRYSHPAGFWSNAMDEQVGAVLKADHILFTPPPWVSEEEAWTIPGRPAT